jgi:hypothetical protein
MRRLLWLLLLVPLALWAQNQNLGNVTVNNIQVNGKCTGNCINPGGPVNGSVNSEINVKATPYNAVGNGSADDTAAIAAAIAAFPARPSSFRKALIRRPRRLPWCKAAR